MIIKQKQFNIILGVNGSGKSTLLKKLAQMTYTSFYLPQTVFYDNTLTVNTYLETVNALTNLKTQLPQVMSDFIKDKDNKYLSELSEGEKQYLNIILGYVSGAFEMYLDEPTNNLDIKHQIQILETLKELVRYKELTVILVTHSLQDAYNYGDNFIVLDSNYKPRSYTKAEFFTLSNIKQVYDIDEKTIKLKGLNQYICK